jgi:hypothetical protein
MTTQTIRHSSATVIAGAALMATGALLLAQQAGFLNAINLARGWPIVLIALAMAQLAATMREVQQTGWGLLLIGDCLLANAMTDWAYAQITWTILLTILGGLMVVRSRRREDSAQERHLAA